MPRFWVRLMLFISSYAPLMIIYAILLWQGKWIVSIVLGVLAFLCLLFLRALIHNFKKHGDRHTSTVVSVHSQDSEVVNYIAAYIIPFVSIPFADWSQIAALGVLFSVLGMIYVRTRLIAVNPTLNLLGFSLQEVVLADDETSIWVITNSKIVRGRSVSLIDMGNDLYLAIARSEEHGKHNATKTHFRS